MSLPETKALPYLLEVEGQVVGVGFEPGEPSVRLLSGRQRFSGHAEPRHIDEAIALRGVPVHSLLVHDGLERRFLHIRPATASAEPMSAKARTEQLFRKWEGLLRRLAR
jgi:hypothetical protein